MSSGMIQEFATWGPIALMVVFFYFLLYRPQKKEQKRRTDLMESMKRGDRVMTIGGLYGTVVEVKDNIVRLQIADKVEIEVAKPSININLTQEEKA